MLHTVTYAFNGDSQAVYFVFLVIQIRIDHCYRIWISVGFLLKDRAVDVVVEFFQIGYGKLFIFVAVPFWKILRPSSYEGASTKAVISSFFNL